ncbi:MAG: SPOR domain-containing protein, partial [bacterium]
SKLSQSGLAAYVVDYVDAKAGQFYRVRIGKYEDKSEAEKIANYLANRFKQAVLIYNGYDYASCKLIQPR